MKQLQHTWIEKIPGYCSFLLLLVLVVYPVCMLGIISLFPNALAGDFGHFLQPWKEIFTTAGLGRMLINSVAWASLSTLLALIIGIPLGILLGRTNLPGKSIVRLMTLIPVMTPPYILALSYILMFQPGGMADLFIGPFFSTFRQVFFSFWGVSMVMAIALSGYVATSVESALGSISIRLEQAGKMVGANPNQVFIRIVLPLLKPAIINASLIVFLDTLSNFGVPAVMGPRANLPLLPAEIYHLVTSWPINLPLASSLSSFLVLLAMGAMYIQRWVLVSSYAAGGRVSQYGLWELSKRQKIIAWMGVILFFGVSTAAPYLVMVLTSLVEVWGTGNMQLGFRAFETILTWGSTGIKALWTSLWLSSCCATLIMILSIGIARFLMKQKGWLAASLDGAAMLPRALPKIVVSVAMIMAWNAPWISVPVYGSIWILIIAYLALYLSGGLRYADSGLRMIHPSMEQAAHTLGTPPVRTWSRILLPLLKASLISGWFITFTVCMRDLVASVILLPPGVQTIGSFIFNQFEQGDIAQAMAMSTVCIIINGLVITYLYRHES